MATLIQAGGFPPAQPNTMEPAVNETPARRVWKFLVMLGLAMLFIYGFLPVLTDSVGVLDEMSQYLDENGIDPTRYYYTDVEQVKEAELYLESALQTDERQ